MVLRKFCSQSKSFGIVNLSPTEHLRVFSDFLDSIFMVIQTFCGHSRSGKFDLGSYRKSVDGPEFLDQGFMVLRKFCSQSKSYGIVILSPTEHLRIYLIFWTRFFYGDTDILWTFQKIWKVRFRVIQKICTWYRISGPDVCCFQKF
jgi:hypothetical protein